MGLPSGIAGGRIRTMNSEAREDLISIFVDDTGVGNFRQSLSDWFREEGRDYPWRRTHDPYAILVSEAMLQQTQIATVLARGYFTRWMTAFPTWESLAEAEENEVLKLWQGLGYYNRARNLREAARIVVSRHGGILPPDAKVIGDLPGVGRYTAGAVMSFAFDLPSPIVDGNVARVLSRIFTLEKPVNTTEGSARLWDWAGHLVPETGARIFNSALMELGQRLCRPGKPECGACPARSWCLAHRRGETMRFPLKKQAAAISRREEHVLLAERNGRIFLCPENGPRRRGLWRLPEISREDAADLEERFRFDYPITRYRVTLIVHEPPAGWIAPVAETGGGWFALSQEEILPPLGAPYRKALNRREPS